jgi:pimeloyl-ACP methyl ester carboxylesterase
VDRSTGERIAPKWLHDALRLTPATRRVSVSGLELALSVWEPRGEPSRPDILLLHGNAAQRTWWDAVAPLISAHSRIFAIDLSGHGDSDRRDVYTLDLWAAEVLEVSGSMLSRCPLLVGHSMGGLVALKAAWAAPDDFAGVIILDTPLRRFTPEQLQKRRAIADRSLPRYADRVTALDAFSTVPETRDAEPDLLRHVASHAFRVDDGEWVLKLDPRLFRRTTDVEEFLRPFPPRTTCVRAEFGLLEPEMAAEITSLLDPAGGVMIDVPAVGHNLVLEAPMAVAWTILHVMSGLRVPAPASGDAQCSRQPDVSVDLRAPTIGRCVS